VLPDVRLGACAFVNCANLARDHCAQDCALSYLYCSVRSVRRSKIKYKIDSMPSLQITRRRRRAAALRVFFFASTFAVSFVSLFPIAGEATKHASTQRGALAAAALMGAVAISGASLVCAAAAAEEA
jgi:hypothetical protein